MKNISKYTAIIVAIMSFAVAQTQGQLAFSPDPVEFGDVVLGFNAPNVVTISNPANSGVSVILVSATIREDVSAAFAITTGLTGTDFLEPGAGGVPVNITFEPTSIGFAGAYLDIEFIRSDTGSQVKESVRLMGNGVAVADPCELVGIILTFFDESIANGTLTGTGTCWSHFRERAMRTRIKAIDFLCRNGYYNYARYVAHTAVLRSDGLSCPNDFVQGSNLEALNNQLAFIEFLLE